jgi:hypothetical protein
VNTRRKEKRERRERERGEERERNFKEEIIISD